MYDIPSRPTLDKSVPISTSTAKSRLELTKPSAAAWDAFVTAQPHAHLLQLSSWGDLKSRFGWKSKLIALAHEDEIRAGALVLLKRLPLGFGEMAYVPMGGYLTDSELYPQLWQAIRNETGASFLKLEPGNFPAAADHDLASMGFQPSPQTIQPRSTIIIDITADDDTILKRMNQGTRRKIRKSLSNEVIIEAGSRADLEDVNHLMQETGERNAFGVHSSAYFDAVYEIFMPRYGVMLLARHAGDLLAAIMVFVLGDTAWYLYGASARTKGNLYASYGIQWAAIQWAKQRGCRYYDLWGVPDLDAATLEATFKDRKDGLWGVYGFKRGWGGEIRRSLGAWDLAFNPLVYTAYRTALKLRR